jgi:hypothetical protein
MASSKRRSSSSGWTTNEICLLVGVVVLGGLTLLVFCGYLMNHHNVAEALGGSFCLGIFVLIPAVPLIRSRRKRTKSRAMAQVVRVPAGSGRGHPDLTLTSDQALPKICIRCGGRTRRVSRLNYANEHTDASPYEWGRATPLMLFLPFFQIIAHVMIFARLWQSVEKRWKRRKGRDGAVLFEIPHCQPCSKAHPILQKHFDFHGRNMIVEVHPVFKEQLAGMERAAAEKG